MKRSLLLLCLLTAAFTYLTAQTTIHLTFTAEANGNYQTLDSIRIANLTQGGDTTLYSTDTVLVLDHGIGIEDRLPAHGNRMILYPAYPNPVTHTSTIKLWLPLDAPVTLMLYDLLGRELTNLSRTLSAGEHTFTFTPGRETSYMLVAEAADHRQVQKLISMSPVEGSCRISYTEHRPVTSVMRKGKSAFPWVPGDDLRFIGFASLGVDTIDDNPVQSTIYTFQFLPPVPPPVADFSVSDTLVYVNDTVHFTDLSTGSPTSWKWFFGDGDSSLLQYPSHIYTATGLYSVTLIVSNAGAADTVLKAALIYVQPPYPPGTIHCNPSNPTAVVDVTNPSTGKIWMDRNLGASQVATSSTDANSYGDLYQWGRFADGHQCRTSGTTGTPSSTDQPVHGNFIHSNTYPYDWRVPQNNNLWQGANGVNNPCPIGYRLPTETELNAERMSWSSNNSAGAFASPLKLPMAGFRDNSNGSLASVGSGVAYWSSTISGTDSWNLYFYSAFASTYYDFRSTGLSVRCLKDSTASSATLPGVITDSTSAITPNSAISGGNITSDGGAAVTIRGVCWSTTTNPVVTGNHTTDGTGTGPFTSNITGLSPGTIYYVRAYATNSVGTAYGNEVFFTTATSTSSYPPGTVHCNPSNPTAVVDITNPTTGKIWMDRNLGASQVATSSTDANSYGDLYQWGRFADGHQCRTSATTTTLSTTDQPGHGSFIIGMGSPWDWRSPQNTNLWQGVNGVNKPCPTGYRLPTEAELNAERLSWSSNNATGAFASPLKLPMAGFRDHSNGSLFYVGSLGNYWSSTVSGASSWNLYFYSTSVSMFDFSRAFGNSVRCLKGN